MTCLYFARSLIDHVFLSPNMARIDGPQHFFIRAKQKSQVNYFKRFCGHRPVLLRLSARSCEAAPERRLVPDRALARELDAMLGRARG